MAKIVPQSMNDKSLSWLLKQPLDVKLLILGQHMEIVRLLINELLEDEVTSLAGERYRRDKPHSGRYSRWGFNPGSARVGDEKIRLSIPRVFDNEGGCHIPLETYEKLQCLKDVDEQLMKRVLLGLSTGDYGSVITQLVDSFGLSRSTVSERFKEASEAQLSEFMERDLSQKDFIALFIDGKYLAKEQIIIALGVTMQGEKIPLGFVQTHSENAKSIKGLLTTLIDRGFDYHQGLLCVVDGSKGIHKAVRDAFGKAAIIQRCQWHKRENVVSYLNDSDQKSYRRKIRAAYQIDAYKEARARLLDIKAELKQINISAARSLAEGLEETLTLHRLGIHDRFSTSFTTTNCIESLNSQLEKYIGRVKHWKNSNQRHRWIACGLIESQKRMRRINSCINLPIMRRAIQKEIQNNQDQTEAA